MNYQNEDNCFYKIIYNRFMKPEGCNFGNTDRGLTISYVR